MLEAQKRSEELMKELKDEEPIAAVDAISKTRNVSYDEIAQVKLMKALVIYTVCILIILGIFFYFVKRMIN